MAESLTLIQAAQVLIVVVIANVATGYFRKKGENFATKDDLAAMTRTVESIRAEFERSNEIVRSSLNERKQLRMAVAEKRLEKHQEAYTRWNKLLFSIHDSELTKIIMECQDWWNANCLYLDARPRRDFRAAYLQAGVFVQMRGWASSDELREAWKMISSAGDSITEAVSLPPLGRTEQTRIGADGKEEVAGPELPQARSV